MAKRKRSKSNLNRRQRSLRRKDERIQRIMIWSAIGLAVVVVGILIYGLIQEYVIKPQTVVARVDDEKITVKEYQSRVYYQRDILRTQMLQYQAYLAQLDPTSSNMNFQAQQLQQQVAQLENQLAPEMKDTLGKAVLDQMIEEKILLEEAANRNITVAPEDVDRRLEEILGFDREAAAAAAVTETTTLTETASLTGTAALTETATPAPMTEAEYEKNYEDFVKNYLNEAGLTVEDFRRILRADVIRQELFPIITEDVATEAEQVKITYVTAGSQEEAEVLRERLQEEETATLLEDLQNDEDDLTTGRELPWYPIASLADILGPGLEVLAAETPVGEISEPVPGQDGRYYVLRVDGHEVRPLDEYFLQQRRQSAFNEWLQAKKDEAAQYLDWEKYTPAQP